MAVRADVCAGLRAVGGREEITDGIPQQDVESFPGKGITTMEAAKAERERFEQQPSQSTAPAAHAPKVVGEQQYTQRTYTPTQDAMDAMMQEWEESHA